jgi:hypothetical protein
MAPKVTKRRSPGEGGAYPYATSGGERWRVKGMVGQPDGTLKEVNKRGFLTKKDALAWLGDAQSSGRKGEYVEPSRQRLGAYGAEVIDGLRVGPQTRASYKKNWRLHIQAYPIGDIPLAQVTGMKLTRTTACSKPPAARTTARARACRRGRSGTCTRRFTASSARP